MGNKIDLITEIYNRLNAAIATDKELDGVKRIQVGAREEARKSTDLPVINFQPVSGEELPYSSPNIAVDNMTIDISLICNKLDAANNLYNATGLGGLRYFELMLNVLDKSIIGAIDQTYNNKGNSRPQYNYEIIYLDGLVEFIVTIEVETAQFTLGSR